MRRRANRLQFTFTTPVRFGKSATTMSFSTLPREFYTREPAIVARELIGKRLLRETSAGLCGGRIVEVEAYLSTCDPACHASRGPTRRNASMFGPPGHAYVYMIHSRWCLNAVTEPAGTPSAILIRAVEPLDGVNLMQQRRRTEIIRDLARGPAASFGLPMNRSQMTIRFVFFARGALASVLPVGGCCGFIWQTTAL
jgi:DNA-3-methyladenine glycosylase